MCGARFLLAQLAEELLIEITLLQRSFIQNGHFMRKIWLSYASTVMVSLLNATLIPLKQKMQLMMTWNFYSTSVPSRHRKHIRFLEKKEMNRVVVEGITPEGIWTVNQLKLYEDGLTVLRAQELVYYRNINKLPHHFQILLNKATGRE